MQSVTTSMVPPNTGTDFHSPFSRPAIQSGMLAKEGKRCTFESCRVQSLRVRYVRWRKRLDCEATLHDLQSLKFAIVKGADHFANFGFYSELASVHSEFLAHQIVALIGRNHVLLFFGGIAAGDAGAKNLQLHLVGCSWHQPNLNSDRSVHARDGERQKRLLDIPHIDGEFILGSRKNGLGISHLAEV